MPCSSSNYDQPLRSNNDNQIDKHRIKNLEDHVTWLEAGLCALISELVDRKLAEEIIPEASRKGLIDLVSFWQKHNDNDRTRLAAMLHRFSVQEQQMIKEILNKPAQD